MNSSLNARFKPIVTSLTSLLRLSTTQKAPPYLGPAVALRPVGPSCALGIIGLVKLLAGPSKPLGLLGPGLEKFLVGCCGAGVPLLGGAVGECSDGLNATYPPPPSAGEALPSSGAVGALPGIGRGDGDIAGRPPIPGGAVAKDCAGLNPGRVGGRPKSGIPPGGDVRTGLIS